MSSKRIPVSQRPPRTRRRDDELISAIREATRAELSDFGYAGVTYEGVARRAKTSKPVLYRRYSSRARMVTDALPTLRWQPDENQVWTGSLRQDLLLVFLAATAMLLDFGVENYRSLLAEADDELFGDLEEQVAGLAQRTIYPALDRARTRGELGPHEIPDRAATSLGVLIRNEIVFSRNAFDTNAVADILDTVYLPLVHALSSRPAEPPRRNGKAPSRTKPRRDAGN